MTALLEPGSEKRRLARLQQLQVLDTEPEPLFDALTLAASAACAMPVAMFNLVTDDRQWAKSMVGPMPRSLPRDQSLCFHTVQGDRFLQVENLRSDPRFAEGHLAQDPAGIRFYAGMPVRLDDGLCVGALCVADYAARTLTQAQVDTLRHLAEVAAQALLSRQRAVQALAAATRSGARLQRLYDATPVMMHSADEAGRLVSASDLWLSNLGYTRDEVIGRAVDELLGPAAAAPLTPQPDAGNRVETAILRRDGSTLDVLMSSLEDLDEADGSRLVLTVIEDVTERRQAEARLDAAHGFLQRTGLVAGVGGWEVDIRSAAVTWSDHTCRLYDRAPGHRPTLGEGLGYYGAEGRAAIEAAIRTALEQDTPWDLELPVVSAAGRRFWARVVGSVERKDGCPVRLVGAIQDVSARRRIEQELRESRELLQVTLDSIGEGVITTDVSGQVRWMNPVAERLTGWSKAEAAGSPLPIVLDTASDQMETGGRETILAGDCVLLSRSGARHAIETTSTPILGEAGAMHGAVIVIRDVSEQRSLARSLHHQATHDGLTGLANRSCFEAELTRSIAAAGTDRCDTLLYIDLDQFKVVNDRCGHAAGDRLLCQVTALLQACVRDDDLIARLGGDEFAIILRACTVEQARTIAQRICDDLDASRFVSGDQRYRVSASIGLVAVDRHDLTLPALVRAADDACYAAKEEGRNRVHVWETSDPSALLRSHDACWLVRLEQALDDDRFELHGQRIEQLAAADGMLRCEALLRLRDVDGTLVLPGQFMPAAERFHIVSRIDRWVVRTLFRWLERPGIADRFDMICVNLSGQSIGDASFRRFMLQMIDSARFDLRKLCFEITETSVITRLGEARMLVDTLHAHHIKVALDDFGAGASWFSYLKSLPVDYIKIDGQFTRDLLRDPLNRVALRCFQEVAASIGAETIAEFVEHDLQRDVLLSLGFGLAQGYLLHKPELLVKLVGHAPSVVLPTALLTTASPLGEARLPLLGQPA